MAERLTETPEWSKLLEEALTMPGMMSSVYCRGYIYSINNQVLLYMQGVREPCATFKRWATEFDRKVKKGAKAKAILRPITVKLRDELDNEGNPKQITKFKLVNCIFGVSDTEGAELPPYIPPTWDEDKALHELNIERVLFDSLDTRTQGYSYERKVAVSPVAGYPLKTLVHELAHVQLGHTTPDRVAEYQRHRGVFEFQAEATAYLVMNDLGAADQMDAAGSRSYIQTWLRGQKPSDSAIKEVFKATDAILRSGRPTQVLAST